MLSGTLLLPLLPSDNTLPGQDRGRQPRLSSLPALACQHRCGVLFLWSSSPLWGPQPRRAGGKRAANPPCPGVNTHTGGSRPACHLHCGGSLGSSAPPLSDHCQCHQTPDTPSLPARPHTPPTIPYHSPPNSHPQKPPETLPRSPGLEIPRKSTWTERPRATRGPSAPGK